MKTRDNPMRCDLTETTLELVVSSPNFDTSKRGRKFRFKFSQQIQAVFG
ncbi:unnamed protein product, partial [Larinioides sclopetarius]